MACRSAFILAGALAVIAAPTDAQEAAPPAKTAPAKLPRTVEGITVTGASQSGLRTSIDRKSYGIASDLQTTTGSISDALRNIPSVEVDPQGNVSLRGDPNVTILLDGKPSGQFKGASAAQALQALPADSIERVEVITNPSAEFSADGSAGIINLISKKTRKPGASGSIRASLGDAGRRRFGLTGAYNADKITVSGDFNGGNDPQPVEGHDDRDVLDGQGRVLAQSRIVNNNDTDVSLWESRLGLDYDADKTLRLSGEARYNHFDIDTRFYQQFQGEDAGGAADQAYLENGRGTFDRGTAAAQAGLRKTFPGDDHTLSLNVSRERIDEARDVGMDQAIGLPAPAETFLHLRYQNRLIQTDAKADYARPMPGEGKLKAGFDLRVDDNRYDLVGLRGVSEITAGPDPTQTNLFLYKQAEAAAYASYGRPFGDWTVLAGLRLEDVELDLDQVTTAFRRNSRDLDLYPSLHLAYRASDAQQLSLSYARRVQRPAPEDLNPFRIETDPVNFRAGNPDLQPQITDSFEAGYQYRAGGTYYLATLYWRRNEHGVTDVVTPLADGAFLTTKANLSASKAAGLELVANGHLTKSLTYNLSANLYWNEIDATAQGLDQLIDFAGRRSAFAAGGRASLTWDPTPKDTFQLTANIFPRRLTPQGFIESNFLSYLGYRRKFADDLFGLVTIQDPFDSLRFQQIVETPTLREHRDTRQHIRGVFFGFTRTFGGAGKKPRAPGFDFGGAAS